MQNSNKIVYTFIAIDRFTKTANKICQSIGNLNSKFNKTKPNINKNFSKPLDEGSKVARMTNAELKRILDSFNKMDNKTKATSDKLNTFNDRLKNTGGRLSGLTHKFDRWADMFGMQAYFKYMNIALPLAIIARSGMKYAQSLDAASVSMDVLFSKTKNYAQIHRQILNDAEKYSKMTPFSTPEYVQAVAQVGLRIGNLGYAEKFMPTILKYAAATGQTKNLTGVAQQLISSMISGQVGALPLSTAQRLGLKGALVGPAQARLTRGMAVLDKIIKDSAFTRQLNTVSTQFAILTNSLSKVNGVLMDNLQPTFHSLNMTLLPILTNLQNFIRTQKVLTNDIGKLAVGITGVLAGFVGLGAVVGAASLAFSLLNPLVLTLVGLVSALAKGVQGISQIAHVGSKYIHKPHQLVADLENVFKYPKEFGKYLFTGQMDKKDLYSRNDILHHIIIESPHSDVKHTFKSSNPGDRAQTTFMTGRNQGSFNHAQ